MELFAVLLSRDSYGQIKEMEQSLNSIIYAKPYLISFPYITLIRSMLSLLLSVIFIVGETDAGGDRKTMNQNANIQAKREIIEAGRVHLRSFYLY